jgi:hypothetical protein
MPKQNSSNKPKIENEVKDKFVAQEKAIKEYAASFAIKKGKMLDELSKQDMTNLIFKQNNLMAQQSSQMLEIIDLANHIEIAARTDEANKCSTGKKNTEVYAKAILLQKQQMNIYENSIRIQIVLFILFILVLFWLIYHYTLMPANPVKQ